MTNTSVIIYFNSVTNDEIVYKDTERITARHRENSEWLREVNKVYILGYFLSYMDFAYLKKYTIVFQHKLRRIFIVILKKTKEIFISLLKI